MDDRSSLLDQLRIERPITAAPHRGTRFAWIGASAFLVVAAAASAWLLWPRGIPVAAATVALAPASVQIGPASVLDASGYVVARRQATVSAKVTGKVVEVLIEEGRRVEENEVIARLDSTNAAAMVAQARAQRDHAQAALTAARVAYENAQPTYQRNEQQFVRAVISAQSFDTAKAAFDAARTSLDVSAQALEVAEASVTVAERNLDDTVVRAPFAGVVTVKAAQEGEMVSPISAGGGFTRTGIGTIVDMDSLEVEVDVSENFINRVQPAQAAVMRLNAYPDWEIPARVIAVIPTADRAKATVKVRLGFEARDARILPQMGVRVAFLEQALNTGTERGSSEQRALLVPSAAVQNAGDTGVVYVINGGTVERRSVRLGERVGSDQIVLSGVTAGMRIAASGLAQLSDGAAVRVTN